MKKVAELMHHQPRLLKADMGLSDAVSHILGSGFLGLPVVDDQKKLIGFLSEQDCIRALMTDSYHCDSHLQVRDIMRQSPLFISPQLSVLELAQIMVKGKPRTFPVGENERVVGLITRGQVMKALNDALQACQL